MLNFATPAFALIFLSAVSSGAVPVPLRMRRRYEWENTWLLGQLFAQIIIPFIALTILLPNWWGAVQAAGASTVLFAMAYGFLWGWGSVAYALSITTIGISLSLAIIHGLTAAVGSIIPMLRKWDQVPDKAKPVILLGIVVCVVATALCGWAGVLRERGASALSNLKPSLSGQKTSPLRFFVIGLFWCLLSGVLSSCANLGFDYADRVQEAALRLGAHPLSATICRWITVYWGGILAVTIGCGSKMLRKGTWRNFSGPGSGRDFVLAILLGCFHFLAQIPYGMGAYYLGRLGTTVGWAFNISFSMLLGVVFGFGIGEWKAASQASIRTLYWGLGSLVASMVILAYGLSIVNR